MVIASGALPGPATGRGLWDFIGRELFEYANELVEGPKEQQGAWRARQHVSIALQLLNQVGGLCAYVRHGVRKTQP